MTEREHAAVRHFEKTVAIKATDDEERTATGVVLTPLELDTQLDFLRAEGIQALFNPDPADGVMHAVWPAEAASLEFNAVLDEPTEIDGVEFDAGQWVIRRQYHDDDLYGLVTDGILNGFSIGGNITEEVQFDSLEDLPDEVVIPDAVDPERVPEEFWPPAEIRNGSVAEISDVDIPAVPAATHAVVKAADGATVKNIVEEAGTEDEFVSMMADRGHDEADARRLWQFLIEHSDADLGEKARTDEGHDVVSAWETSGRSPADENDNESEMTDPDDPPDPVDPDGPDDPVTSIDDVDDATLGKRFKRLLFGDPPGGDADGDHGDGEETGPSPAVKAHALGTATAVLKEGRSLNASNREALMAAHDAIESALSSAVEFEMNRFTDNDDVAFSLDDFGKLDTADREDLLKAVTSEQAEMVVDAMSEFTDTHGESADVRSFEGWLIEHDFAGDLDPDQLVALNVALQDFFADREFGGEALIGELRTWLGRQTNNPNLIEMSDSNPDADGTDTEKNSTDDDPEPDEPPAWAKALQQQAEKNTERLDELFGEPEPDMEKALEDAPAWAKGIYEKSQQNAERLEQLGKQGGQTTQVGGGTIEGEVEEPDRKFDKAWDETFRVAPRTDGGER